MMKSSEIRQIARNKLAGNWPKAFAITTLFVAIDLALTYCLSLIKNFAVNTPIIYYAVEIIFTLLLLPVTFGYISTMIKLINGKKPAYTEMINDAILNSSKVIGLFFRIMIKIIIPALIIIVAAISILFLTYSKFELNWNTLSGYLLLILFLYLIAAILIAIISLPYSLANYALANDNTLSSKEALEKSIALMDGNKWNLVKLILSFMGWMLLIGSIIAVALRYTPEVTHDLITGIGSILLLPYIISSIAIFYDELNDVKIEIANDKTRNETATETVDTTGETLKTVDEILNDDNNE